MRIVARVPISTTLPIFVLRQGLKNKKDVDRFGPPRKRVAFSHFSGEPLMTLDLNQIHVETFEVSTPDYSTISPIVSTDQVPHCDGYTAGYC
jgi:hypothetical protein